MGESARRSTSPGALTYRAELSGRVLRQLGGFPASAFDALIMAMSQVVGYPDDPLRTFPTSDPYVRRAEFGGAGLSSGGVWTTIAEAIKANNETVRFIVIVTVLLAAVVTTWRFSPLRCGAPLQLAAGRSTPK